MYNEDGVKTMKLSVIVPVYNVEQYIHECMESILMQTMKEMEIIVVDDGSTDNSIKIINKFNDDRIKVLSKPNGGLSSARNAGLRIATGEYIAFVDSDDFLEYSDAYEDMYNIAINNNVDIVAGNANWYFNKYNKYPIKRDMKLFNSTVMDRDIFLINSITSNRIYAPVWLNIYRRDYLIKNNLFFKEGILHEDEHFTPRAILRTSKIGIYSKEFYAYRQRQGSIMNSGKSLKSFKDIKSICFELEEIFKGLENDDLKKVMCNYLSKILIESLWKNKIKNVTKDVKIFIKNNSYKRGIKLRIILMNININIYYKCEDIFQDRIINKNICGR